MGGWRGPRKPEALYITWLLSYEPKSNWQRGPVFDARPVHMWSVVQNVAQEPVFLRLYPLSIIPPTLHTHFSLICPRRYVMFATDSVFNLRHFLLRTRIALIVCYLARANFRPHPTPTQRTELCVPTSADAPCTTWQKWFNKELFLNCFINTQKFRPFRQLIYRSA